MPAIAGRWAPFDGLQGGLKWKVVSVTMTGPDAADVVVDLQYPDATLTLTLHIVPVNGAWRIYDLSTKDMKSYRADLLKANNEATMQHP